MPAEAARVVVSERTLSPLARAQRARRIGTTFGRVYLGIKANQLLEARVRPHDMRERWSRFNRRSAESIYEAAVDLRGLILKGCQFMGSRSDVLPREYVEVLSKLQDRVPPKAFPVVRRVVEGELGRRVEEVFESFSERPIAAASLAQVHEARLRGGERVAVKVQYPEVATLVQSDLANLRVFFRAIGVIERNFDLIPLIDELGAYVPRELDFVNEAANAETAARQFAGRDDVRVPRIHHEFTTRRLLVMEFIDGIRISDTERLLAAGVDVHRVVQTLVEAYCEQVLVHGFFHADPHPGNLLVEPDGPRLVMLDFGLSKDLPEGFREAVVRVAVAMLRDDAEGLATALHDMGFETKSGEREALRDAARFFLDFAARFRDRPYVDPRVFETLNDEIPDLVRRNPIVRIPGHVVLLGRVLGLLSGISRTLGSRVDLLRTLMPYALGQHRPAPSA
ncbi:aarF domain-containing kinase [Myxococcaceae bacterium]|nr:aarF domain-containing kinase [Myxococcaceae bacterium]